jgi:mannose-6-phosphate isomerase-like protein (cupin superfamily)
MAMRALSVLISLSILALAGPAMAAAAPGAPPPPDKLYSSAADLAALIANARANAKPDVPNFIQPIARLSPYSANLEYRTGVGPAALHHRDAEMFTVIEGSGTMVTGGRLVGVDSPNPANLRGTGIEGGQSRKIAKGDVIWVPPETPHWFSAIDAPALVLMALHVPAAGWGGAAH